MRKLSMQKPDILVSEFTSEIVTFKGVGSSNIQYFWLAKGCHLFSGLLIWCSERNSWKFKNGCDDAVKILKKL